MAARKNNFCDLRDFQKVAVLQLAFIGTAFIERNGLFPERVWDDDAAFQVTRRNTWEAKQWEAFKKMAAFIIGFSFTVSFDFHTEKTWAAK